RAARKKADPRERAEDAAGAAPARPCRTNHVGTSRRCRVAMESRVGSLAGVRRARQTRRKRRVPLLQLGRGRLPERLTTTRCCSLLPRPSCLATRASAQRGELNGFLRQPTSLAEPPSPFGASY